MRLKLNKLYLLLIEPQQKDEDLRNRELVLNVLFTGTIITLLGATLLVFFNYLDGYSYLLGRVLWLTAVLALTIFIYTLSRLGLYKLAAWYLVGIYMALAVGIAAHWGITFPPGALLFGLTIMVTGTVLGAPFPLYVFGAVIVIVAGLQVAQTQGIITADTAWAQNPIGGGILLGICFIFGIIALISWLFNEQTVRSLHRAERAEAGLLRQKMLLEIKVEERTRDLQAAQLEKIQQLYRFAELGQLSTALMHDLANHLTSLTLDIEGLESKDRSDILNRAKSSIHYIDDMVLRVRDQLHGHSESRPFNVASETQEVIAILNHRARRANVLLHIEVPGSHKNLRVVGEPVRFRQLVANLLSNAIDSYDDHPKSSPSHQEVNVVIKKEDKNITVTIIDWGKGISGGQRSKIFQPLYSTKKTGMGMGLYMSRKIAKEHFGGDLCLADSNLYTAFIISLPKA